MSDTADDHIEWWVRAAMLLAVSAVLAWGIVLLQLGHPSVFAHVFAVPICGGFTLPIALWGLIKTAYRRPVVRRWRIVGFGLILVVGFFCNVPLFDVPLATSDWSSEHRYRLPFDGAWYTMAGGPRGERNYHATTAAYRWGYDFVPRRDGSRYRGNGESLEAYYCWDEPVLAPVAGQVVSFEDDQKDYPPREFAPDSILGNHVVLKVGDAEFLFVAHLQKGSLPVEVGDEVERGERIGDCGNSGRAVEPHVHVHLQDRSFFPIGPGVPPSVAQSLPLRFSDYEADGSFVEKGMPLGEGEGGEPAGEVVEYVGRGGEEKRGKNQ